VNNSGAVGGQSFNFPIKRPRIGGAPSPKFGVIGRASGGAKIPAMKRRNLTKVIFEAHWIWIESYGPILSGREKNKCGVMLLWRILLNTQFSVNFEIPWVFCSFLRSIAVSCGLLWSPVVFIRTAASITFCSVSSEVCVQRFCSHRCHKSLFHTRIAASDPNFIIYTSISINHIWYIRCNFLW